MDFMFDWEGEGDRFSFEDSDRFEEDSLCSWISEPESLCNNWRGWRKQNGVGPLFGSGKEGHLSSLVELAAQAVACHIPFEVVEHFYPPIPENLQLRIAFWSFPENEEDIRLYSCLANGSADEFQKGDHLFKAKAVKDALQIGFHLSATVIPPQTLAQAKGAFNVAVVFDRRRITSCMCTCNSSASWCAHVVALCLYRIHQATSVCLRAPVSESLSRLHREQLQKFAQYLISELPQQILPTAQRLLDELLSSQQTAINTVCGAPDPTAGPSASEQTTWCLDEGTLHENIKKTLIKFCIPSPIVFSDVNYLSSTAPPVAAEWQSLLRPLRGREPEGMWNLLSIIREMYKRNDCNAIPLLRILSEEVLNCEQILVWWFNTKISASHNHGAGQHIRSGQNSSSSSQHAASSLCDEIVMLWRLAALNPALSPIERDDLASQVREWHILTIDKVRKARGSNVGNAGANNVKKADVELFSGFKPSIEACTLDWTDYVIAGITYEDSYRAYWKFSHAVVASKAVDSDPRKVSKSKGGVITSQVMCGPMNLSDRGLVPGRHHPGDFQSLGQADGAYSSGSEGFCDSERRDSVLRRHDSDSDLGDIDGGVSGQGPGEGILPGPLGVMYPGRRPGENGVENGAVPSRKAAGSSKDASVPAEQSVDAGAAVVVPVVGEANDEYQVYFYDTNGMKPKPPVPNQDKKKKQEEPNYFAGIKPFENKQDILFARAEALHAHGHTHEACKQAKQLAEDMLANPPDLSSEQQQSTGKGKKKKAQSSISSYASSTLAKAAFLCSVLLEEPECHHLAFRVGLFGLEMPRPPASSKALEVKLAYQESEMVNLLKRIPLGLAEVAVIRSRAESLRDGKLKTRGEALLPLTLASFVFDSLGLPMPGMNGTSGSGSSSRPSSCPAPLRHPADEKLGFEAATAALGLKANVSEADHALLCEGTRRQRGELSVTMLAHYKDDQVKLSKIMDKLLDKEVHQLFKAPSLSTYLSASSAAARNAVANPQIATPVVTQQAAAEPVAVSRKSPHSVADSENNVSRQEDRPRSSGGTLVSSSSCGDIQTSAVMALPGLRVTSGTWIAANGGVPATDGPRLEYLNLEQNFAEMAVQAQEKAGGSTEGGAQPSTGPGARPKTAKLHRYNSKDTDSSALEEEAENTADYKAWAAKFRCTNLKTTKKHSTGMASIDSSAPETTSSDNSPTLVRRSWTKHMGPGSDSGSSGKSSDSIGSSNSGDKLAAAKQRENESPPVPYEVRYASQLALYSRSSTPNIKGARYKGKNRIMPTIPNMPSEASAHFMFELAKTVLAKAGGNSSTSLFTQPANNNNPTGPHRALHLCAFQIGLYALGLYNCVSPNWLSRTYSSHVSWITGQAMEIGSAAINILIDTWEGHLTPQEVASLADRASRGRDPNMVRTAAELALSCLPHSQALNPNEIQRALIQCKEQSQDMLERACLAVERAAKGGGVYPEVLFDVARRWYELYEESIPGPGPHANQGAPETEEPQLVLVAQNITQAGPGIEENIPPLIQLVPAQPVATTGGQPQGIPIQAAALPGPGAAIAIPYTLPPPHNSSSLPHHPYIAPYSYVQQVSPNFAHHYSAPHIPLHTHNMHPSYMATYPYNSQAAAAAAFTALPHLNSTMYHANVSHLRPPPPGTLQVAFPATTAQLHALHNQRLVPGNIALQPVEAHGAQAVIITQPNQQVIPAPQLQVQQQLPQQQQPILPEHIPPQNTAQMNYLMAAYRVGMLAMETQARRVHDDRPQTKYARNPSYGEDVKWLLSMAMKLGVNYLQQFCASAVNAIVSPFVLHDIAIEAAHYLARNNPAQVQQQLRNPTLTSLVQKCLQMFIQCTHQRMHHISQADYDEFVSIVCSARNAFYMTPGGMVQFNEMLQSLRRSKSCKKDLWQRIVNGLSAGNI